MKRKIFEIKLLPWEHSTFYIKNRELINISDPDFIYPQAFNGLMWDHETLSFIKNNKNIIHYGKITIPMCQTNKQGINSLTKMLIDGCIYYANDEKIYGNIFIVNQYDKENNIYLIGAAIIDADKGGKLIE